MENKFIEEKLAQYGVIEHPTLYEKGLYDVYLNIKKELEKEIITLPATKVEKYN